MSMKRTCAISSRKSDFVSADIRGLEREESTRLERKSKNPIHLPECFSLYGRMRRNKQIGASGESQRSSWGRGSRFGSAPGKIERQQTSRQQRGSNNENGKFPATPRWEHRVGRNVRGPFHSLRRRFKGPGNIQRDGKSNRQDQDQRRHRRGPFFMAEKQKRHCFDRQPCGHRVSGRNFVNIAPLKFTEESLRIH